MRLLATGAAKQEISRAADYSENLPRIEARKLRNEVEHGINRLVGRDAMKRATVEDATALPFLVESGGSLAR